MAVTDSLHSSPVTGQAGDVTFTFVSGRPSLDFAGTLKWRSGVPEEQLSAPAALTEWIARSGLVTDAEVTVDHDGLRRARALREAIYRLASAGLSGRSWSPADLLSLNRAANERMIAVRLDGDGTVARGGDLTAVLATLARDAITLLGGPDADRIRECGDERCTRLYVDGSRTQNRRWCGMVECGNRVKAAAYRQRKSARNGKNRT